MILYKYTSSVIGLDILRSKSIRFTQMDELNDPFESHLPVQNMVSEDGFTNLLNSLIDNDDVIEMVIEKTINDMYAQLSTKYDKSIPKELFREYIFNEVRKELAQYGKTLRQYVKDDFESRKISIVHSTNAIMPFMLSKEIGILSLTSIVDNEVMWSHYSDSHRGIVIGFNSENDWLNNCFKVSYKNDRPLIDASTIATMRETERLSSLFGIKNEAWSYEEEYRIIEPIKLLQDSGLKDSRGVTVYLKSFPPQLINVVVYGNRLGDDLTHQFQNVMKSPEYQHVNICREILDSTTHKVLIEKL